MRSRGRVSRRMYSTTVYLRNYVPLGSWNLWLPATCLTSVSSSRFAPIPVYPLCRQTLWSVKFKVVGSRPPKIQLVNEFGSDSFTTPRTSHCASHFSPRSTTIKSWRGKAVSIVKLLAAQRDLFICDKWPEKARRGMA